MTILTLRKAVAADLTAVLAVEKRSTPNLHYLGRVFDLFLSHSRGEFTVCEIDGEVVACAKLTVLPDGSAWLESIRVIPERQGLGVGKRFYENYFDIAQREGIKTLRMYTGVGNKVSKGLAERYGLQLSETFSSMSRPSVSSVSGAAVFEPVTDPDRAVQLVMPHAAAWGDYLVMNRTFYRLTAVLCQQLARQGMVYAGEAGVVIAGARFMPEQALHLGFFAGDTAACLDFAAQLADLRGVSVVSCLFPAASKAIRKDLMAHGYLLGSSSFIVMDVTI